MMNPYEAPQVPAAPAPSRPGVEVNLVRGVVMGHLAIKLFFTVDFFATDFVLGTEGAALTASMFSALTTLGSLALMVWTMIAIWRLKRWARALWVILDFLWVFGFLQRLFETFGLGNNQFVPGYFAIESGCAVFGLVSLTILLRSRAFG